MYRTSLWIIVSPSVTKSIDTVEDLIDHRIIEQKNKKSTDAYTYAYQYDGKTRVMVFVNNNIKEGRVAHEANHIVNIIQSWNGVKPSYANDEAESYYLEVIVDKIHDTIKYYKKL